MKQFFTFVFLVALVAGCKPKVLSGKDLENKLKETMSNYLDTTSRPGTKFIVKDVLYYPEVEKEDYICHFNVEMHYPNGDTTGTVIATITNDFKTVKRKQ
jgi:hypothetical protein